MTTDVTSPRIDPCVTCGMQSVLDEHGRCHGCRRYTDGYTEAQREVSIAAVNAAVRVALEAGVAMEEILEALERSGGESWP
jgi:hypothetical protein